VARIIALIILAIATLAPLTQAAPHPWLPTLLTSAVVAATGLWIIYLLLGRETYVVFSAVGAPVLVLMTYGIVRYTTSEIEAVARPQMIEITAAGLLFLLVFNFLQQRWQLVALVWILAASGVVLTGWGFWQVLSQPRAALFAPATNPQGLARALFREPSEFAVYLHLAFSMAGAYTLFSRRSGNEKILFALSAVVSVAGLALTQTPRYWAGWFAAATVLGLFLLRKRGWKPRWYLLGGGLLLVFLFGAFLAVSQLRLASPKTPLVDVTAETTAAGNSWQRVLSIGHRHLIGGTGPGLAIWLYPSLRSGGAATHALANEYLAIFAEYGAIGVLLTAWALIALVLAVFRGQHLRANRYSAATPSNRFAFAIGGFAALAAVLVDGLLGCSVRAPVNLVTVTVLMAAALTCGIYHHSDPEDKPPKLGQYSLMRLKGLPRYVLAVGLAVLLLLFGSRLVQTYPAAFFAEAAQRDQRALRLSNAQTGLLRACRLDNRNFTHPAALGDLFAVQATWNAAERADLATQALRWYERSLTLNPYHTDVLVQKARMYQLLGQSDEATTCLNQALMAEPRNPSYLIAQGLLYQELGKLDRAHHSFQRAHDLDPQNPLPVHQLHRLAEPPPDSTNAAPSPVTD
jgi:tetratricopeptide (TPR) repeat protein